MCNLQSDVPVEELTTESEVYVTNYYLKGFSFSSYSLTDIDIGWIDKKNQISAPDDEAYNTARHCLSTSRWHTIPRTRLAILWPGIEGLFKIDSEITFRISLYIAYFLEPDNPLKRRQIFNDVKKLYRIRSRAVHGGKVSIGTSDAADQSASLLLK